MPPQNPATNMVKLDRSAVPLKSGKGIYPRLRVGIALLSSYQQAARIRLLRLTFRTGSLGLRRATQAEQSEQHHYQQKKALSSFHLYPQRLSTFVYRDYFRSIWPIRALTMAFVALGFFSLIFHFGKSPPLSIKPEVHRVGESKRGSNQKQFPDNWRPARHFGSTLSFRIL